MNQIQYDAAKLENSVLAKVLKAINQQDYESMEFLRGEINEKDIPEIVKYWRKDLDWDLKDGFVTVLMDQKGPILKPLMSDALNSPTVESRAYALCVLSQDFKLFTSLLSDSGWVDADKVNAAVQKYKSDSP